MPDYVFESPDYDRAIYADGDALAPVLWLPCDQPAKTFESDAAGADVYDRSRNNPAGTLGGGATYAATPGGLAISTGGTGYADLGTSNLYNFTSQNFSVTFWANRPSVAGAWMALARGVYSTAGWYCYIDSSGFVYFATQAPGTETSIRTPGGSVIAGKRQHFALIRNGSSGAIYLDGVPYAVAGAMANPASYSGHLWINKYDGGGNQQAAAVSDVRVYAYDLTPAQVLSVYNGTDLVTPRNRVARYAGRVPVAGGNPAALLCGAF